jgi:small subunit ribosomal protein S3Ae
MDITRDKLCQLVKKWHTMIESFVQTKTSDGYMLRMFCIGFTKRTSKQVKATCYTKGSQEIAIRKKMMEIMVSECQKSTLKELGKKLYLQLLEFIICIAFKSLLESKFRKNAARFSHFKTS